MSMYQHQPANQQPPQQGQQAPYPGQQPPYPGQQAPYPGQQPPYPGQQAPYPGQQPPIQGQAPYPGQYQPPPPGQQMGQQPYNNPPPSGPPLSKVELKISCRKLVDLDVFSKSDPFAVVYMQTGNGSWSEIGRTEKIENCCDPDFVKSFTLDYYFEEQQMIKFEVYDSDGTSRDLRTHDFIGRFVTSLGSLVGENGGTVQHPLQSPSRKDNERNSNFKRKSAGIIIVRAEELSDSKDVVSLRFSGQKLDKKDFFGKSDPFLIFERSNEDNSYSIVHKTEIIKNTLNPNWKSFTLPARVLCNGDYKRTIKVTCYDWDNDGTHDLIGSFQTTLEDLAGFRSGRPSFYDCINPKKKKEKKSYKNSGTIHVVECVIQQKASFLDYLKGGLQLNFVVAIDFTASNGDPRTPQSLHHNTQVQPSQYVQALQAIGRVIEDYDSDKLFPSFGFGARIPPQNTVLHDFALNFNPQNPFCQGINGVIGAYYNSIQNVQLYGPTNFAPVIQNCIRIASQQTTTGDISQYSVLLILTDGIITDMDKTKEAIVHASNLPISIIIVGVGTADFSAMEELDGDDMRVSYNGRSAARDIVQFVPFKNYMKGNAYDPLNGVRLAKEVLHELPNQVTSFMEMKGIKPKVPPASAYS